ncbi:MAG: hypothetical protein IT546_13855 [Caulobacteraceae bacterium]|nr:hypothetical protein [Caulobacteraceae bacterium]
MTSARLATAAAILLSAPAAAAADGLPGKIGLDMRLRAETVEQDGFGETAQAVTLRARLGYETPEWNGFAALVEGEAVAALADDYNSSTNGKLRHPLVTDPETVELNRLQLSWTGTAGQAVAGRQRLVLGAGRFVGNVGFRQNEQTFDAVKGVLRPAKEVTLTYAYLDRVHRVFGDDHPQGDWDSDTHLLQADASTPAGQLSIYGYLMAFETAPAQSNATWGARLSGARPLREAVSLTYEAEYARQTGYRNSPADFDLSYAAFCLGLKGPRAWASLGAERLDGDGRRGFATPLATLHAFQGWADVFLTTPPGGVRDLNLRAGASVPVGPRSVPLRMQAAAHDFASDDGAIRYGRELDLLVGAPLSKRVNAELKAALFDGARPAFADRTKVWLTLEFKY